MSGRCIQLREPARASYNELGARVEQLLRLAAEQAAELVDAARTEAGKITASAGPRQPCPRCGAS
jgi:F0F1-type ATP synthase membrane subunit b/b'